MTVLRKQFSEKECLNLLNQADFGILSLIDEKGLPYGVPLNFVYDADHHALLFHLAKNGRKKRGVDVTPKAHFCIVLQAAIVPESFVTHYDSLMLEGHITDVIDDTEKVDALRKLGRRLAPTASERLNSVIKKEKDCVLIWRFHIDTISGKQNRDT